MMITVLVMNPASGIRAEEPGPKTEKNSYSWESLQTHAVPAWFEDAKFGIFIHWGPYSVIAHRKGGSGYAEHVPKEIYMDPGHYYPFMKKKFGAEPPEFGYKDVIPMFKAEKWHPETWADLFQKAGARYVALTAEHHDGFALWNSALTPWCATKMGPMRDLVGDLGKAVRAKGMRYALSYHRERHSGYFALDMYATRSAPRPDIAEEIRRMPEAAGLYGPFEISDAFIADYVARWKEIETKYRPDFMWIDHIPHFFRTWNKQADDPQIAKYRDACMRIIADYFNAAEKWDKEVYLNNKGPDFAHNWPLGIGCREKDNYHPSTTGEKWQNPATLGTSYGYLEAEEEQDAYKSPTQLVHLLCGVVSKNGNLLLNIGPRADGTIPEGMQSRLLALGDWLKTNGEAIYGTRPWVIADQKANKNGPPLAFTTKGDTLYAIALEQPRHEFLISLPDDQKAYSISGISLLGSTKEFKWSVTDEGIGIVPPAECRGEHAWVFRVSRTASKPVE